MKKRFMGIALGAMLALGAFGLMCCAGGSGEGSRSDGSQASFPAGEISVYSREDGSGTRSAFVELFGIEQKDASGQKVDMTTSAAVITNSTAVMMTSIAGDPNGIGYISLGSLNDTVKALEIDGVQPSAQNVKSGEYKVSRPFNVVTREGLSEAAQDFMGFVMSADGQRIVEESGYIAAVDGPPAYAGADVSGKVVIAGSSSVTPVMEKLAEAYEMLNPNVVVEVQQSDSTTGVNWAVEGTCDIGIASRDLKGSEAAEGVHATVIARDGIAVIVSKGASVTGLTSQQVMGIYTGDVSTWEEL